MTAQSDRLADFAAEPDSACAATLALLAAREPGATLCPSEVARSLAARQGEQDWRAGMAAVHAAVDHLVAAGMVRLSWKGRALDRRDGPYRITRPGT